MSDNLNLIKNNGNTRIYEKINSFKVRLELEEITTTITAYDDNTDEEIGHISLKKQISGKSYIDDISYLLYYISDFKKAYRRNGIAETIIKMFIDNGFKPIWARNPYAQRSEFGEEDCSYLVDNGPAFVVSLAKKGLLTYEGQSDDNQYDNDFNCM